jgi:hypothetical protein
MYSLEKKTLEKWNLFVVVGKLFLVSRWQRLFRYIIETQGPNSDKIRLCVRPGDVLNEDLFRLTIMLT